MASVDSILKTIEVYREALRDEAPEEEKQTKSKKQELAHHKDQKPCKKEVQENLENESNVVECSIS